MNLHFLNIIIRREYLNKVKKKSFLLITFLTPILFAALCILPSVIMIAAKEDAKNIAVVDESSIVLPFLNDTETLVFEDYSDQDVEQIKSSLSTIGKDAVLSVSALDTAKRSVTAEIYSNKPLGVDMTSSINNMINDAVENYRIESYDIENLESIMGEIKANVRLTSYTMDEEGKETVSESSVYMLVSMLLGMVIFMFITMFSGMVMTSVIEEKSSRIVEVLVSSVNTTELLFGKIIGVAMVAITQFFLWIVLTFAILGIAGLAAGPKLTQMMSDPAVVAQSVGMGVEELEQLSGGEVAPQGAAVVISTLSNMPVGQLIVAFVIFFIFGYLLYAALFAAIGSSGESEADTQQLQLPVTVPLMIGFFIALYAFKAPDSSVVFWGSMIPFTSPIVMLARIPFGVPTWELVLSLVLLVLCFVACAYVSAKIYKVGILMYGKKSTWKDLWQWLKQ